MAETKVTKASLKKKPATAKPVKQYFSCICCGEEKIEDEFYSAHRSRIWKQFNDRIPLCKSCCGDIYDELTNNTKDPLEAVMIMCHYLDIPFLAKLAQNAIESSSRADVVSRYVNSIRLVQYAKLTYSSTLLSGEMEKDHATIKREQNSAWSAEEIANRNNVINLLGYDPFTDFTDVDRKYLFSDLIKYLDDEETVSDTYKLSQVIQLVVNNGQIHRYDVEISRLKPSKNADEIKNLNGIKKDLVAANDKIASSNEISVKNRSNKEVGKGTLTHLMRELRGKNFAQAEANYYNQLKSAGTQWAVDLSNKSMMENIFLDENDYNGMILEQRALVQDLQKENDDLREELRLLKIKMQEIKSRGK